MTYSRFASVLAICLLPLAFPADDVKASSERKVVDLVLTVDGDHFEINGTEEFLIFVSYFDALDLDQSEWEDDFDYLTGKGIGGIRVMVNWWTITADIYSPGAQYGFAQDTLVDHTGSLRPGRVTKLLDLLDTAKDYGLVVDLSFTAENVGYCPSGPCYDPPDISSLTREELKNALEDLTDILADAGSAYKHVMFDLQNEFNHVGPFDDEGEDIEYLRDAVKAVNFHQIVTASISSSVLPGTAANRQEGIDLDVVAWHEYRAVHWYDHPDLKTEESVEAMKAAAPSMPIYLQEPERMRSENSGWLNKLGLAKSLYQAKTAGAAAWTFHNGGSMYLNTDRLEVELKAEDKAFLTCIPHALEDGDCTPGAPSPLPSVVPMGLLEVARDMFNAFQVGPFFQR